MHITPATESTTPPPPTQAGDGECVVCRRPSSRVVWREAGYKGRQCACGLVFVSPQPPPGAVDPLRMLHEDTFYALPAAYKVDWLQSIRPDGRLLEVGCGDGRLLEVAQARGYDVAGIEPHPERARRTADRLGIDVECAFIERSSLPAASFDLVYHCDLLSHFPDPAASLRAMSALLRPGGRLVLEVGILGGIAPFWYHLIRHIGFPHHRWLYSDRALELLFAQSGLRVVKRQRFGMAPQVLVGAAALLALHAPIRAVRLGRGLEARGLARLPWLPSEAALRLPQARLDNYLRYRVGRYAPEVGPQTLFIALEPVVPHA